MNSPDLILYMVSDSSGETVTAVSKAAVSQFENIKVKEYMWSLVRTKTQIDKLIENIKQKPGIVLYTIISEELRQYLKLKCKEIGVPCISPISKIISEISNYCGITASKKTPHKEIFTDLTYFKKIEAMNFTITHDDGQQNNNFNKADILIVGVSRTSKSPTSLYLAQRGYKVANWPIINSIEYDFSKLTYPLIVGLTISIDRLIQIRHSRLIAKNIGKSDNEYIDALSIEDELKYANKILRYYNIPIIDVTSKAIEEVAAEIINLYFEKRGGHLVSL